MQVVAVRGTRTGDRPDSLIGEEPLEIRLESPVSDAETVGVIMRTPGNDFELTAGFLFSEGIIVEPSDLRAVRYCAAAPGMPQLYNTVTAVTSSSVDFQAHRRSFLINASCGICGTSTLEQLDLRCQHLAPGPQLRLESLMKMPDALRRHQRLFDRTGGLHGAGLFTSEGDVLVVREDVGRHNAVDKLVGWALMGRRVPLAGAVLVVSGRVSYEIVQKALLAGIPALVAVSAPSDLAVATAKRFGLTILGFVRGDHANIYSCPERVRLEPAQARSVLETTASRSSST